MFAVGINNMNMNGSERYFDFQMTKKYYTKGKQVNSTVIPLQIC